MDELLEQAIKGDNQAYVELMEILRKDLYAVARARLNNIEDINDAIQETILISFQYLYKLKNKESFKSWVIKILINECNKIYRSNLRQTNITNKMIYNNDFYSKNEIEIVEGKIDFETLIEPLKYEEKIIVTLYYGNGFTVAEIAKILNTNVHTIKSRLRRLRDKIKIKSEKGGNETYEKRK